MDARSRWRADSRRGYDLPSSKSGGNDGQPQSLHIDNRRRPCRAPAGVGAVFGRGQGRGLCESRRRSLIDSNDPDATAKPNARLIKLLIRAHRFHATLIGNADVPFAALAKQEGVSRSYFTRLVRLSYLAPDITQAILDGHQPPDLTTDKLLAHSRLPLTWHEHRT